MFAAFTSFVLAVFTCSWPAVPAVLARACVASPHLAAAAVGYGAVAARAMPVLVAPRGHQQLGGAGRRAL